jgi:hypothetical protein
MLSITDRADAGAVAVTLQPQPMAVVFDFMKPDRATGDAV